MDSQELLASKREPPSFNHRLGLLVGTAIIATGGFTLAVYDTVTTVQIHGPLYTQIVQSKDLATDALPPPLYIVDSYLVTLELLSAPPSKRKALVERFKQLEQAFIAKQAEWHIRLSPGFLRSNLTESSGRWATEFYEQWNREFLPAVERGDTRTMTDIVHGPLTNRFEQHRLGIFELVELVELVEELSLDFDSPDFESAEVESPDLDSLPELLCESPPSLRSALALDRDLEESLLSVL